MDEKMRARLAYWKMALDGNTDRKVEANIQATFYGNPVRYPEAIPDEANAKAILSDIADRARQFDSRYIGECDLTDATIGIGDAIYYLRTGGFTLTVLRAAADQLIGE